MLDAVFNGLCALSACGIHFLVLYALLILWIGRRKGKRTRRSVTMERSVDRYRYLEPEVRAIAQALANAHTRAAKVSE